MHAPLPQHVLPEGLHKVRYFGLCHPRPARQHATCRHRSRHSPSPSPSVAAPAINPPSPLSVSVQTAASAISSSSAGSCQNSPKDRIRMPRGALCKTIWVTRSQAHGPLHLRCRASVPGAVEVLFAANPSLAHRFGSPSSAPTYLTGQNYATLGSPCVFTKPRK